MPFKYFKKMIENTRRNKIYTGEIKVILTSDDMWEIFKMFSHILNNDITKEQEKTYLDIREKFINCKGVLKDEKCPDKLEPNKPAQKNHTQYNDYNDWLKEGGLM